MTAHPNDGEPALRRLKEERYDEHAWTTLYNALAPRAHAIAFRLLGGDRGSAQDAVHDAFVRLIKYGQFEKFASWEDLIRYFSMMVRHAAVDALKHRRDQLAGDMASPVGVGNEYSEEQVGDWLEQVADPGADAESAWDTRTVLRFVEERLNTREMLVFTLLGAGYSRSEVAARLGISNATAAVVVHRLRAKVRDLMHKDPSNS